MFGHTVCDGENGNTIQSDRELKYADAVKFCAPLSLWNPLGEFNDTMAFGQMYRNVYGMTKIWTGLQRFNESHLYFMDQIIAIDSVPLCETSTPYPMGRFKSSVVLSYKKSAPFGFYAVSFQDNLFFNRFITIVFIIINKKNYDHHVTGKRLETIARCFCWTRGLYKNEINGLLLEIAIIITVVFTIFVVAWIFASRCTRRTTE